jgi:hypothetical protein
LASRPFNGETRPPRTMYFSVFTLTRMRVSSIHRAAWSIIASWVTPFSIAWAMRSTTNPNPPEMFFESMTLMGFPRAWLIVLRLYSC